MPPWLKSPAMPAASPPTATKTSPGCSDCSSRPTSAATVPLSFTISMAFFRLPARSMTFLPLRVEHPARPETHCIIAPAQAPAGRAGPATAPRPTPCAIVSAHARARTARGSTRPAPRRLLDRIARLAGVPEAIDCSGVRFADPYGVLVLLAIGLSRRIRRGRAWGLVLPRDPALLSWLARCGARRLLESCSWSPAPRTARETRRGARPRPGAARGGARARGRDVHRAVARIKARADLLLVSRLGYSGLAADRFTVAMAEVCQNVVDHSGGPGLALAQCYAHAGGGPGDPARRGGRRHRRARQPRAALRGPPPGGVGRPGRRPARLPARGDRQRGPRPRPGPRRRRRPGARLGRDAAAAQRHGGLRGRARTRGSAAGCRPSPAPKSTSASPTRPTADKGPSAALDSSRLPATGTRPPQSPDRRPPCIRTLLAAGRSSARSPRTCIGPVSAVCPANSSGTAPPAMREQRCRAPPRAHRGTRRARGRPAPSRPAARVRRRAQMQGA